MKQRIIEEINKGIDAANKELGYEAAEHIKDVEITAMKQDEPPLYGLSQHTLDGIDEALKAFPSFQHQLATLLDRPDVEKAIKYAIWSTYDLEKAYKAVLTAIKEAAND